MRAARAAIVVLASLLVTGCGNEVRKPPAAQPQEKVRLASAEFGEEYQADRKAAEAKYRGRLIELEGEIKAMGRNASKSAYISLEGAEDDLIGVMCFTADSKPWKKYVPGQKVKIRGQWAEPSATATLNECVVVEAGPNPAPALTAEQLAMEYSADLPATIKKYDKKYIFLSGEIVGTETNDAGAVTVELKGDGQTKVTCAFTALDRDLAEPLKVGQKVDLIGQFTLNFGKGEAKIYFCMPRDN
jgi:hypothetical protein